MFNLLQNKRTSRGILVGFTNYYWLTLVGFAIRFCGWQALGKAASSR